MNGVALEVAKFALVRSMRPVTALGGTEVEIVESDVTVNEALNSPKLKLDVSVSLWP